MNRIKLQDRTTRASNRLVVKGSTIHKNSPFSEDYTLQKGMMGSPDLNFDEQRKVKRILHEIRNSLVEVWWSDEKWRDARQTDGYWTVRRRALAAIASSSFQEETTYRWLLDVSIALVKELRSQR